MNYAMQMMETYTEMLNTSEFAKRVANDLNKKYNSNYTYEGYQQMYFNRDKRGYCHYDNDGYH